MRDYSKYEKTPVLFSGAEKKFEIIIDGYRYIVKFQKNSEVGLIFNYVSEYLGFPYRKPSLALMRAKM